MEIGHVTFDVFDLFHEDRTVRVLFFGIFAKVFEEFDEVVMEELFEFLKLL
jgi:hypothetical protein